MSKHLKPIDYLAELEKAQKQYEQYAEVSQLYKLPIFRDAPAPKYVAPTWQNPLTTDRIHWK